MVTRFIAACALILALVGCSSPPASPTTPPAEGASTPTAAAATPTAAGGATSTAAGATATPAAGGSSGSGGTGTVDGTWTGTWTKPAGGGTMTLQLQQSGTNVTGTITMVGSVCVPPGTAVSGTVVGPNVVLDAAGSGFQATWGGGFRGNSITGTLSASCSAGSAVGTWTVTRS